MKTIRKIYDATFKAKAVELSNERSNITELAKELGIRVSMLVIVWLYQNLQQF